MIETTCIDAGRMVHRLAAILGFMALAAVAQTADDIRVSVGKSVVIDYPEDIARISTSSPDVVDAVPATTREILLHGKSLGSSTVIVWSKSGQRNFYNVNVEPNLEPLRKLLKETFPSDDIQVQAARDSLSLTGRVSSQAVADRALALATPYAKSVVNNLTLAAPPVEKQIVLRVKFAELNRSAVSAFGVNLLSTGALNTVGRTTTQQFQAPAGNNIRSSIPGRNEGFASEFTISDALNVFMFRPDLNLGAFIKALQSIGLLQILAEPNLVTTNGKDASFHVGGEFPVPVLQGGANAGAVTIQFREFGIRLNFNPQITPNRTIKMHVRPEVSTIDLANAVTFSGFTIPALATRKIETDIELGEGQSFVIGGLLDDRVTESFSKIPGLANIPILGALFRSREERKTKTELVVLVTPEITMPLNATDPKPLPSFPSEFLPNTTPNAPTPARVPYASPRKSSK
ncbi:MAG: pilus assembly protein N-terminal domain-containing protein [Bryobacteraceae bacterium]|nr:pilus assembly protein N-terminal domain-containing protein [Bryobacteraceae bacterium]MDW8378556.1 pilus assembly protein N-terminal domain-containing protein [Bryobacterales bacterium]